jgi:hypothetical protein
MGAGESKLCTAGGGTAAPQPRPLTQELVKEHTRAGGDSGDEEAVRTREGSLRL